MYLLFTECDSQISYFCMSFYLWDNNLVRDEKGSQQTTLAKNVKDY